MAAFVVVLGDTKVYEHGLALAVEHYVGWLDVEVKKVVGVDFAKGVGYLTDVLQCCGFCQCSALFYHCLEALAFEVFHYIVGGAVLFKDIVYFYDVAVVEGGYEPCLFEELLTEALDEFFAADRGDGNLSGVRIAVTVFLHEELLEGDLAAETCLFGKVGYTEAALTEYLFYSIISIL